MITCAAEVPRRIEDIEGDTHIEFLVKGNKFVLESGGSYQPKVLDSESNVDVVDFFRLLGIEGPAHYIDDHYYDIEERLLDQEDENPNALDEFPEARDSLDRPFCDLLRHLYDLCDKVNEKGVGVSASYPNWYGHLSSTQQAGEIIKCPSPELPTGSSVPNLCIAIKL